LLFFLFIAKLYLSYCFFLLVVAMLSLSSFIYLFIFTLFTVLACIVFRVYHALDMDLRFSPITYLIFNTCGINFKISGGVTATQWL
jgi:hypothetical protein